jgi:hypothetical protein
VSGGTFAQSGEAKVQLDDLRKHGYEALYNLDYEEARRSFKEMVRLFPEHPAGPQCMAASLWLEELNRSRRLRASLYDDESIQKGTGTRADKRTVDQFRDWIRKAKLLSEARLRDNPKDPEALYFLGATEGLKAVFTASVERRFLAASRDAASASDRHREVLKLDPGFHDAELTIGMYDYVVGSLPLPLKMLATIGGVRGSKKRGLETLERVARDGHWARDIARVLLVDLYKRERRWNEAVNVSRDLSTRYPGNYLFQLQLADSLVLRSNSLRKENGTQAARESDESEAFRIFASLLNRRGSQPEPIPRDVIHFRFGENLLLAQEPERAAQEFLSVCNVSDVEADLATLARLRAAQAFDLAGKRREALNEYQAVLKGPNVSNAYEQARNGLRQPYRR